MSTSSIRAVALDRQPLWLDALEGTLSRIGVDLTTKCTKPADALDAIERERPDVFLTELASSDEELDGLACVRRAREVVTGLRAIVLSDETEFRCINDALAAGAAAYVIKTAHPDDIASAVRQVFHHSIFLAGLQPEARPAPARTSAEAVGLTRREREILQLVSEGYSNAQLARMLWVTEQTVKFHLSNVYRKLDVGNRTEAARWATVNGILDPPRALSVA